MSTVPDSVRLAPGAGGLPMLRVDGSAGWAEIYLHGAHVTAWAPRGQESVLWLSGLSRFDESTAIRGGIPVCFPWFGPLAGRPDAPRHGFARTAGWTFDGADDDGQDVTVRLTLSDSDATRGSAWPHPFSAVCTVVVGARLTVALEVTSTGDTPVTYEEALHTYLAVADVTAAEVTGLEGIAYLDKTAGGARVAGEDGPLRVTGEVDRIYVGAPPTVTLRDRAGARAVHVAASGSGSTVVWNPGREGARATSDLDDDGWSTMLCVEASNVGPAAVHLEPGESHTLVTSIATRHEPSDRTAADPAAVPPSSVTTGPGSAAAPDTSTSWKV
ncbi:MAG: D-hexose-6-phosphate mutarotase [Cellulomonas sp.]